MARYVFSYKVDGVCKLYAESTVEEERSNDPYLTFWLRCKTMIRDYRRIAKAYKNNVLVGDDEREDFTVGKECKGVITDLDYETEKEI